MTEQQATDKARKLVDDFANEFLSQPEEDMGLQLPFISSYDLKELVPMIAAALLLAAEKRATND